MNMQSYGQILAEIATSQAGLFTSAQASRLGVPRNVLAYMAKTGKTERLEHGVYRISGTPRDANQGIYAVWLSTNPQLMSYERHESFDGIVVGGRSAAALQGVGDFFLSPYRFFSRKRINSKRQGIVFTKRFVDERDITYTDSGLPVTTVTRTVFDLIVDNEDASLIKRVLSDAMGGAMSFDDSRLVTLVEGSPRYQRTLRRIMVAVSETQ